jgi:hypothetical protein
MDRRQLGAGLRRLVLGFAALVVGCGGGEAAPPGEQTTIGTGNGGGPGTEVARPPSGPSGQAPVCSVVKDIALGTGEATSPAVAFAGGRFAAAWVEQGTGLHVAVVDRSGSQVGAGALQTGPRASEPAVTALPGGGFLVVWQEPGVVRGMRVGADASPVGAPFAITTTAAGDTRPDASGTTIAWTDTAGARIGDLHGAELGHETTVPGAAEPAFAGSAALVFNAGSKLGFARLGSPGGSLSPVMLGDATGKVNVPRASPAADGRFYVTWEDGRAGDGNESVYLTLVSPDGKQASPVTVPDEAGSANYPDVATLDGYAAVVYYQFRDGPSVVYLSLIGPDLRRAGSDLPLSGKGARFPRIASGDGALGVVYAPRSGPARLSLLTCH